MADVTGCTSAITVFNEREVDQGPVPLIPIFATENAEGEIINAVMADVTGCTSAIAVFNEREREVDQGPVPLILKPVPDDRPAR